ncbi:lytic polysaccharide monooxygenase [Hypoxylon crocopeplum]|nr:lytic polysaccharide monooxygenase [Hypoxylon crocopeplum]
MIPKSHLFTAAAAAFMSLSNGHMIMQTPKPFGGPDLDNSPLTSGNYPCKLKGDPATFYKTDGLDNTMAIGESQTLSFKGSAVHGGGSCQLAITKDSQPSPSTSWQVILSIEGGCPSKSGQGPDTYDFKIPGGVAPGNYVFAWAWISKLAGQPEFYMNCAPITVTGGKSKRSDNETMELMTRDGQFPELFVANLADINSCKTEPSTDPEYPDPGPNVMRPGTTNKFAKVQGNDCVPKGAKSSGGSGGNSNSNAGSGSSDGGNSGSANGGNGSGSGSVSSSSSAASSSGSAPATTAATSNSLPTGLITSVITGGSSSSATVAQSSSAAAVVSSAAPASSSSPAGSGSTGSGSTGGLTGPCSAEGMFNCIGGTAFQQCASGSWSVVMQMPATVKCALGQTMTLWGRDETPPRKIGRKER